MRQGQSLNFEEPSLKTCLNQLNACWLVGQRKSKSSSDKVLGAREVSQLDRPTVGREGQGEFRVDVVKEKRRTVRVKGVHCEGNGEESGADGEGVGAGEKKGCKAVHDGVHCKTNLAQNKAVSMNDLSRLTSELIIGR